MKTAAISQLDIDAPDLAAIAKENRCIALTTQSVSSHGETQFVYVWHAKQAIMEPHEQNDPIVRPEFHHVAEIACCNMGVSPFCIGCGATLAEAVEDYLRQKRSAKWICTFLFLNGNVVRPLEMPYRWDGEKYVDLTIDECIRTNLWCAGCKVPGGLSPSTFWTAVANEPNFFAGKYDFLPAHPEFLFIGQTL